MITVVPECSLIHESVSIRVDGLEPFRIYRLELRLLHKVGTYRAYGVYTANSSGIIDLKNSAPLRGTYAGINERGLFESIEPTDSVRFGGYCNCTPPVDFNYQLILFDAHNKKISEKLFSKQLMHPLVERIEIEESYPPTDNSGKPKVTGTMFKPPGNGPFPTIIDISGSGGGLNEQKGAAFASRGFATLCLAFFQFKELPSELMSVDLQYFQDAIEYVISLPYTSNRIGFQGVSFGGSLVMFLSTKFKKIKAVCSINGSWSLDEYTYITVDGLRPPVGIFPKDGKNMYFLNDLMVYADMCKNITLEDGAGFDFEKSEPDTAFRFVTAMDDLSTPTIFATQRLSNQLRNLNRKVDVQMLPGGHLLDPPCFPHHPLVWSKFAGLFQTYGGETSLHGKSEFAAWEGTVKFFSDHLGAPTPLPDYLRHSAKL